AFPWPGAVLVAADRRLVTTGHQGRAARRTDRRGRVRMREPDSARRKTVEMRRTNQRFAVTGEIRTAVFENNVKDVRSLGHQRNGASTSITRSRPACGCAPTCAQ